VDINLLFHHAEKADAVVDAAIPLVVPLLNFLVLTRDGDVLYQRTAGTRQLGSAVPLEFNDVNNPQHLSLN
jgi:hypothetical protein